MQPMFKSKFMFKCLLFADLERIVEDYRKELTKDELLTTFKAVLNEKLF